MRMWKTREAASAHRALDAAIGLDESMVESPEEMLPESLLATRPVSTERADGTLRDDFKEGGKNVKDRTYPIMFLSTNEL